MAFGLTGMPSVWGDLNMTDMAQQNQDQLAQQQDQIRKKKLLGAGAQGGLHTAAQTLLGGRNVGSMTPLV